MKPSTQLEKRVYGLSQRLDPPKDKQLVYGEERSIEHICLHNSRTDKNTCVECGHVWKEVRPHRCPTCGNKLVVEHRTRRRVFEQREYFSIVQKVQEFMVVRTFYLHSLKRLGEKRRTWISEVYQHWVGSDGKRTIMGRNLCMMPYYRYCPFSLDSEMSVKRNPMWYEYFAPRVVCPRFPRTDILKRNGLKSSFHGMEPKDVIVSLLTDNRFETLWKLQLFETAKAYLYKDRGRVMAYWRQILWANKENYPVKDIGIWFDYLDLLKFFGKDVACRKFIFPADLQAEHDRYMEKKRLHDEEQQRIRDRERRAEEARRNKEKRKIFKEKSRYFNITFHDRNLVVVVLSSISDYRREGSLQHHCVYTNAYYGKKGSLILSARKKDTPDLPLETVEISLENGSILQCFGKHNTFTEYHDEVMKLVKKNSYRFINQKM